MVVRRREFGHEHDDELDLAMTTTTAEAIIDQAIAVILDLTPLSAAGLKFDRSPRRYPLRDWAAKAPDSAITRKFEIRTDGALVEPEHEDIACRRVMQPMLIQIAYAPKLLALYGPDDLDDLEDIIETDGKQIRDALYPTGGLCGDGHIATVVNPLPLERFSDDVWFQPLAVEAHFWVGQSLTF